MRTEFNIKTNGKLKKKDILKLVHYLSRDNCEFTVDYEDDEARDSHIYGVSGVVTIYRREKKNDRIKING